MVTLKGNVTMNRLPTEKRAQLVSLLVEGNSLRATSRISGVAYNTVLKFVADVGKATAIYQDKVLRGLKCQRVQVDEIWAFCYAKDKNLPEHMHGQDGMGSVWTWVGIDADSKLAVSWLVGSRDEHDAIQFVDDLAGRLANRVQLTSDGHNAYLYAVDAAFGGQVDYSMLIKKYGPSPDGDKRYSPPVCIGADKRPVMGNPDPAHISTSYVERQNLTMRMSMRRFTRLTNAFSKKIENHAHSVALHFLWYNFGRIHRTLRVTPAMAAGVADRPWNATDVVAMLDDLIPKPGPRGPYRKRRNSN
jgi:IS1 family transposase